MTDPMRTNERKRYDVTVALKDDHGDLEIAQDTRSFVHKIHKEFEKENDNVICIKK